MAAKLAGDQEGSSRLFDRALVELERAYPGEHVKAEVANGFESAFSGASGYAFVLPPGGSASLHLHHEIQVYAGGVNSVVSYLEYSWQGVLA